jgi:hypothetical protein
MAEETPQLPPPQVPIRGYTTPVNQEGFFSERVDYTAPEYRVISRGTKYSTILGADPNVIDQFAELYFLRETREIGSYPWAMRFWATDTLAEDTYNSSVEYVSEAVTYPAYTRVYTVRRDSYEASTTLPIGGTLTSIIAIKVIDGGQDYTEATITIDDSVGSDATAEAVIDVDGTIASIVVTNCGSGYTSVPTVTITGDGGGTVAIAIIQPQTAYLVSQKKTEFPDEKQNTGGLAYMHPLKNEYVIITRIYETLPGPWVYSYKEDIDGALLTIKTRRNIGANIVTEETISSSTWSDTTAKGVDNFVSEETNESRSIIIDDGTAVTATKMTTSRVDDDGKTVTVTRAQASAVYLASITTRETIVTGVWKRITSEPISHLKVWMIVETRVVPGNAIPYTRLDDDGKIVTGTRTLKDESTITTVESLGGGTWTHTFKEKVGDLVAWQVTEARPIPGNAMVTTRVEEDGIITTITKTMSDTTAVVSSEVISTGVWIKTHKEEISDLVAWKVVESRAIPGNPLVTTKIDDDGKPIVITKTLGDTSLITSNEVISVGIWIKTYKEEVSDLVAYQVQESRAVPGNTITESKVDEDGKILTIAKILSDASTITPTESANGTWIRVEAVPVSDLVAHKVTTTRDLPGNPIPSTQLDKDGKEIDIVRTLKKASTIVTAETLGAGAWTKTTQEKLTDLVSWEVVEARPIPGNPISSATIDGDSEVVNISTKLRDESAITPSSSESGGFITTVEKQDVSDLIANEITKVTRWLDKAVFSVSIPEGIIPLEFRANVTTTTTSHIIAGTATLPTLAAGEFEHSKRQLTKNLYEERITELADLSFPVVQTGTETSSQFGGAVLDVARTLSNVLLTADEGVDIVSSYVNPIGNSLMWFKETKKRPVVDTEWPILTEYDQDPETLSLITTTYQVIDATSVAEPSIVAGVITRYKKIDKWRSFEIIETYSLPASYEEQRFMAHNFPSLWDWHTYNYNTACGAVGPIREGFSTMVQARLAISFSISKETITGLTLIPNTLRLVHDTINAVLNDAGTLFYVGTCSGPITFIASSPDYSTYIGTIQNTEQLITGESVLWRAGLYKNSRLYVTML